MTAMRPRSASRRLLVSVGVLLALFLLPVAVSAGGRFVSKAYATEWWQARRDSSGLAPDPATTPEAVVQVYAARTYGWRGAFGVHTWFAVKPAGARDFTRLEVIGWGVRRGAPSVRVSVGNPDGYWYGNEPKVLLDLRGAEAQALVERIIDAAGRYPYPDSYRVWPGPNSNTFTAFVAREVPEMKLDLPPNAVGKDFLPNGDVVSASPSGTGVQFSLYGLFGVMAGVEEGVELNLLGLTLGIDANPPALKLPGLGRVGWD